MEGTQHVRAESRAMLGDGLCSLSEPSPSTARAWAQSGSHSFIQLPHLTDEKWLIQPSQWQPNIMNDLSLQIR